MSCFTGLSCVVLCLIVFEGECHDCSFSHTLVHVTPSSCCLIKVPFCHSLLFFFSMLLQAHLPLAFCLVPEAARPDSLYICPLVDLDMDLFPDNNEGVQAICDY